MTFPARQSQKQMTKASLNIHVMSIVNKYIALYSVTGEFHSFEGRAAPENRKRAASKA